MSKDLFTKLKTSKFAGQFLIYLGSGVLAKIIPFLILPLIANELGPTDFGRVANFNVLTQFFLPFLLLKQEEYYKTHYFKLDRSTYQEYFSNSIFFSAIIATCVFLVIPVINKPLSLYFKIDGIWIGGAILASFGASLFLMRDTLLRFDEKAKAFSAFQVGFTIATSAFALLFVIAWEFGWQGRIIATIISSLVFIILSLGYLYRNGLLKARISLSDFKVPLRFSLPLMPQALTPLARNAADKLFITNYVSLAANGVYSLVFSFSLVFEMVIDAFQNAYLPRLFKLLSQLELDETSNVANRIFRELIMGITLIGVLILVGYFLLRMIIIYFLDASYGAALIYLPYILINVFFNIINRIQVQLILNTGSTMKLGYSYVWIAVIHIALSLYLVQHYGVEGVIIALLTATLVRSVLFTRLLKKSEALPWGRIF